MVEMEFIIGVKIVWIPIIENTMFNKKLKLEADISQLFICTNLRLKEDD